MSLERKEHAFKFAAECPVDVFDLEKAMKNEKIEYKIKYIGYKDLESEAITTTDKECAKWFGYGLEVVLYVDESLSLDDFMDKMMMLIDEDAHRIFETIDYEDVYDEEE